MNQLTFKFPFKINYFEEDFYVSENNFSAYKLIENWPKWSGRHVNIFGPSGCGKTHLANIFKKKINSLYIKASELCDESLPLIKLKECLIIDDYKNNIEEKLFYSILNLSYQSNQYVIVNSLESIKTSVILLHDLKSRFNNFVDIGIDLPTDNLIRVILTKNFSDKQVKVEAKLLEYVLKNIIRSYDAVYNLIDKVDSLSLSTGKSININLIKKVLNK